MVYYISLAVIQEEDDSDPKGSTLSECCVLSSLEVISPLLPCPQKALSQRDCLLTNTPFFVTHMLNKWVRLTCYSQVFAQSYLHSNFVSDSFTILIGHLLNTEEQTHRLMNISSSFTEKTTLSKESENTSN